MVICRVTELLLMHICIRICLCAISNVSWKSKKKTKHTRTLLFLLWHNPVHFVRLRDIKLGSVSNFLKIWALVECTAQSGLPCRWFSFIPLLKLPFKNRPRLWKHMLSQISPQHLNCFKKNLLVKQLRGWLQWTFHCIL